VKGKQPDTNHVRFNQVVLPPFESILYINILETGDTPMKLQMLERDSSLTNSNTTQTHSRRSRLTAQWLVIDGKLICQWIIN
jgi:hypothetical protein